MREREVCNERKIEMCHQREREYFKDDRSALDATLGLERLRVDRKATDVSASGSAFEGSGRFFSLCLLSKRQEELT